MNKLKNKKKTFVTEYPIDLNATQAAIRAGYSPHTAQEQGARLLSNVKIKQAIDGALSERANQTERKALDVLNDIQEIAQKAKQGYMADPTNIGLLNGAIKALELEGKHLGITEKLEIKQQGEQITRIERIIIDPREPQGLQGY